MAENFVFRPVSISDIAAITGQKPSDISLETDGDTVTIGIPTLTSSQRTALRSMFLQGGKIEDSPVVVP